MSDLSERLLETADQLESIANKSKSKAISKALSEVRDAANEVARSWSGSYIGYQSRVYYANLQPTPPGAHFSVEWGAEPVYSQGTVGDWREYTFEGVRNQIFRLAGVNSLDAAEALTKEAKESFENAREEFLSIATLTLENASDAFLSRLKAHVDEVRILSKFDYAKAIQPRGQFMSRDMIALGQGIQTPPHLSVIAEITALQEAPKRCMELSKIIRRAASHLETKERHKQERRTVGTNVFIGHGHSTAWKDLKDFIQDRLGLPWDEFNRVPAAGITNIQRLSSMLDEAAIAFLIMTGEDEQKDGTVRARENVIHEAGLFQGKLGFTKAIIVLEEGCEEFSNIHGLGQIRFPKGNIKASFEEIRMVLEREGIIE
jgi:predicted nucleotide-binding protein